ncbi:Rpn family recombination-promoting nuclease/putative transposase [Leptothoe spongobia]|uniref:Rpn family recombination-promoting nuclease/putative transposase n=1 Tax=Leptothoe spongobia TAU-MAC 1115 TaxID=1967444 RepID=A0A947DDJ2_9CYAN|nr:Rpn family recombination-promoting nuclease/putative transposase [Leptothoe spongobia]MBT9315053.1 Rpn family recombination-promoting nuclease/putative transposase [Leptothoe spongobia TAU-MAC 1115]
MKTDSLFYLLFETAPSILFELIGQPALAPGYRFSSVELKQTAFRIDGVFLPPEGSDQPVYFVEVQFQKDPLLYRRLFAEVFLFLQKHPDVKEWCAVAIYPRGSLEPDDNEAYGCLLQSDQCQRIFLDELAPSQSVTLGLVKLIVEPASTAIALGQQLMQQAREHPPTNLTTKAILNILETIILYKFPNLTRQEIANMFAISDLKKTKVYEEFYAEWQQEALAKQRAFVVRLLKRKVGELPEATLLQVDRLSFIQLEDLAEALFDFSELAGLDAWLNQLAGKCTEVLHMLTQRLGPLGSLVTQQIEGLTLEQLGLLENAVTDNMTSDGLIDWLEQQPGNEKGE